MLCYLDKFDERYLRQEYVGWLNDSELMKYSEQRHYSHTVASCSEYVDSFKGSENLLYAVIDIKSKRHVGNINAYIDRFNQTADVGILIAVGGCGYGISAWNQMLDRLFSPAFNIRKVNAGAMSENSGMIGIFEKSGMSHEYTKVRHFCFEQRLCDMKVYYKECPL